MTLKKRKKAAVAELSSRNNTKNTFVGVSYSFFLGIT